MSHRSIWQWAEPPSPVPGRRRLLTLLGLGIAGVLGACGKKGPLRLPEPAAPAAPASPEAGSADEETE